MFNEIVDFSDAGVREGMVSHVAGLRGRKRVTIVDYRPRRSDRQNRYYWPAFVEPFARWIRENWGDETATADDAHEILKGRLLVREFVDRETGEVFRRVGNTSALTTAEFNAYLDRCADFLAEYCDVIVPPAGQYRERE